MSSRSENDIYFLHSYSTACSSLANKYLRNVDQETWIESKFEEKRIFFRSVFILSFLYFQVFVYAYLKYSHCFPIAWQTQKKRIEFNSIELIRLRASIWHNSPNTYARASVEFIAFPEHCFFSFEVGLFAFLLLSRCGWFWLILCLIWCTFVIAYFPLQYVLRVYYHNH